MTLSTHRGISRLNATRLPCRREGGFSVTELVIVVSILGVLSGIAVVSFNQFLSGSKDAVAAARVTSARDARALRASTALRFTAPILARTSLTALAFRC